MRRVMLFAVVLLSFAALANAQCQFNASFEGSDHFAIVSGHPYALTWTPVAGASTYRVTEARGYPTPQQAADAAVGADGPTIQGAGELRFETKHFASADSYIGYAITALAQDGTALCSTKLALKIQADPTIRNLFRRAVVPVAGSLVAADGSKFHTSLRLALPDRVKASGRIIFHPQGAIHSDNDPSMAYQLEPVGDQSGVSLYWDDVVAAMGASGLGSLDIAPDDERTPEIDARAWNDIHGLINGGTVPVLNASDLFRFGFPFGVHFPVWTDNGKSRMSIGIRTVGPNPARVFISTQGMPQNSLLIPGNSLRQFSLESVLGFIPPDGQPVQINLQYINDFTSSAYVYYTITDNSSNDPRVFLPQKTSDLQIDVSKPIVY